MCCIAILLLSASVAAAQEKLGAGRIEIDSALLGGGVIILPSNQPQPKGYVLDVAAALNVAKHVSIEGDFTWSMSHRQAVSLAASGSTFAETPTMLFYSANLVYSPFGKDHPLVPYLEVGGGGMSVKSTATPFGLDADSTHFATNIGTGLRWFIIPHWGARADYRYIAIAGASTTSVGVTPIGHMQRLYGALVLTF
jgi:opacity protein-like surface antigen